MRWVNVCCETDKTNKHLQLNTLNMKFITTIIVVYEIKTVEEITLCTHTVRLSAYPDISCISVSDVGRPAAVLSVGLKVMENFEHSVHGASHGSV